MVSREASFLFNNLVFIVIAFAVLWGTLLPILSEAVVGVKYTVLAPWFNTVIIPLGLALLALTGIGPLIAWRRASVPNLQRQFAVPGTVGVFTALILLVAGMRDFYALMAIGLGGLDRKSTRLNSSHVRISYAAFCLQKKVGFRGRAPGEKAPAGGGDRRRRQLRVCSQGIRIGNRMIARHPIGLGHYRSPLIAVCPPF